MVFQNGYGRFSHPGVSELMQKVPTHSGIGIFFATEQAQVQWWHKGIPEKVAQRAIQAFELLDNRADRYALDNTDAISVFKQMTGSNSFATSEPDWQTPSGAVCRMQRKKIWVTVMMASPIQLGQMLGFFSTSQLFLSSNVFEQSTPPAFQNISRALCRVWAMGSMELALATCSPLLIWISGNDNWSVLNSL